MSVPSQHTVIKGFRITRTQNFILASAKYRNRGSAIIRALLNLYLNGHLKIEHVIEKEIEETKIKQESGKRVI